MGKWKRLMATALCGAVTVTSVPGNLTLVKAAEKTQLTVEDITPFYNVDCGDFDVTTAPQGETLGQYQSVTEQVYGEDGVTGKKWGIVDNYEATPPNSNLVASDGLGLRTNWTWAQENGGFSTESGKGETNRYTKNQYEERAGFGETRMLDYQFELPAGTYEVKLACVDPWGCSKSPVITLDGGAGAVTSSGYNAGTVYSASVEVNSDKTLKLSLRGTGGNNLAINIAYIEIAKEGYSAIYSDYVAATVASTVKGDFTLPSAKETGDTITWTSDSPAIVIDGYNATVTRAETDTEVTLTARIENTDAYIEKKVKTIVKADKAVDSNIAISDFANEDVLITDLYFNNAYDQEVKYLAETLDTDRLLAGFRETAAYAANMSEADRKEFMRNVTRYNGWENSLIGGHTLGHYMSAIAQAYANEEATEEQKAALLKDINACVSGLKECQDKTVGSTKCKEGYLFGATLPDTSNLEKQFDNVEESKTNIFTEAWVPWYTMHKILAGLVDCYKYAGNEEALEVATKLGLWTYNRVGGYSASEKQKVLNIEYGGMNDALYELYILIENNPTYKGSADEILKAAEMFDEISLFNAVKNGGKNVLNNRHANTTIPKFIGSLKRYIALGEDEVQYLEYAEKFWDMVVNNHTYITGGNSENEHFGADNILYAEETTVNNETCNTYNMLKLSRELFKATGNVKYADYYENTLLNAIMASQNPETGMSMYFQPMATGYHKVFGNETTDFWCCTGSGMENFVKLNDSIYFKTDNTLIVNNYISSDVNWKEKGLKISQKSGINDISSTEASFTVSALGEDVKTGKLAIRIPNWVADAGNKMTVTVNGTEVSNPVYYNFEENTGYETAIAQNRYIVVEVNAGDVVKVNTPMKTMAYNLPDSKNTYAFKYGPLVLSAKLGADPAKQTTMSHGMSVRRASSRAVDSDMLGIYSTETVEEYMENIDSNLVRGEGNAFKLKGANCTYEFVPHYSQYKENYGIYWTYYVGGKDSASIIAEKDYNRKNRVTIDSLQAGYGQYEPGLGDTGHSGSAAEHIRYANAGGYFEYEIKVDETCENYLMLTLRKEDNGDPLYVSLGDKVLYGTDSVSNQSKDAIQGMLSEQEYGDYYQIKVALPKDLVAKNAYTNAEDNRVVKVKFAGTKDKESACLYNWSYCVRAYETKNHLQEITFNGEKVNFVNRFALINTGSELTEYVMNLKTTSPEGYVTVNGNAVEEATDVKIDIAGYCDAYTIDVYAEDFNKVESYEIRVLQDTGDKDFADQIVKAYSFEEDMDDIKAVTKAFVPAVKNVEFRYTDGVDGKAVVLDGDCGLLLGNAQELGESYTIAFWMKPNKLGGQYDPTFAAGVFSPEYWLNLTFDGKIWSRNGNYIATSASNAYKAKEWQHVMLVVDGTKAGSSDNLVNAKLYVNGTVVSEGDIAKGIMTNANAKLYFGVNAWDAYFSGAIDEMILMNTALSTKDAKALYSGEINKYGTIVEGEAAKAAKVMEIISKIGEVKYNDASKAQIEAAQKAYNALSDEAKALVTNYTIVTEAAGKYEELKNAATAPSGSVTVKPVKPVEAAVGTKLVTSDGSTYVVTSSASGKGEVDYAKSDSKKKTVTVPDKVVIKGITYQVTGIANSAFANNKKIKSVVIGKNVKKIGKKAFYNCKNLKKITVKATGLKSVGSKALKGIHKKAVIKLPKSKAKAYKKLFKKKGQASTVKVK